jgi:hypothetical protein
MIARARLAGRRRDDPELQLQVRRAFQKGHVDENVVLQQKVSVSASALRTQEQQMLRESRCRQAARFAFVSTRSRELRSRAGWFLLFKGFLGFLGTVGLTAAALLGARLVVRSSYGAEFIGLLLAFLAPALSVVGWFFRSAIPRWKEQVVVAEATAEEELGAAEALAVGDSRSA